MNRSSRPGNVEIHTDDHALTGHAGLVLTGELAARTGLVARLDRAIDAVRPFKHRRRGRSAGELLVALAVMMAVAATTWCTWTSCARTRPARSCVRWQMS
jgi:hypothetical protein